MTIRKDSQAIACNHCSHAKWLVVRNGHGIEYMCQGCGSFAPIGFFGLYPSSILVLRQFVPKWNAEIIATHLFCFKCSSEDRSVAYQPWENYLNHLLQVNLELPVHLGFRVITFHGRTQTDENIIFDSAVIVCQQCAQDQEQVIEWLKTQYFLRSVSLTKLELCTTDDGQCCHKTLDHI